MKLLKNKILLITCLLISLTFNSFSQSGWVIQYQETPGYFYDIYFINNLSGWAVQSWSDGKITKTTNGGLNWYTITTHQFQYGNGITFYDQSTGWICTSGGGLYRSTNSGNNWTPSTCNNCTNVDDFVDIQFINLTTGWAYGDVTLFKTTDKGENYFPVNCGTTILNGFFLDSLNGWVGGHFGTSKSTNGGNTWYHYAQTNGTIMALDFVNLNDGWLCTYQGKIYKTTNSAVNWTEQFSNDSKSLYKIHFVNENTGWVVGDSGSIIKTTNAGVNWYKQSTPTDKDLYGIFMVSPTEGWICGERYILHTTDGGGPIGIQPISSEIPICFSLSQNYPNPFNPVTKIKFSLPVPSKGGVYMVQLVIYDILGRKVASLIPPPGGGQEGLPPGVYEVEFNGSNYTSGVYFYKLIVFGASAPLSITKKMILLK